MSTATAVCHPNIALVKYWGKRNIELNLPAVGSLSLTLDTFATHTTVDWGASADELVLNGEVANGNDTRRVMAFLDLVDAKRPPVRVKSRNNFPSAAGLASSSSAFAALALAAVTAAEMNLTLPELSVLARRGSGSACRSLWGGFVQWDRGTDPQGLDSHGAPVAPRDHWDVSMVVGVVSTQKKPTGSTEGMERSRLTSPLYETWVRQAQADVVEGRAAVLARDLDRLGRVMESSTFKMHASMMSSDPPLLYWKPGTVACLHEVFRLRDNGISAWATMDAGPQVKVLCPTADAPTVAAALEPHTVAVHILGPGGAPTVEHR